MKLLGTFAVIASVANAQDDYQNYETYEYQPAAADYPLDTYSAGDFGTENDAQEATYDTYVDPYADYGDYPADGPGGEGEKAHHEIFQSLGNLSNNNNNNNNSNKRPNNNTNKRPNSNKQNNRPQQSNKQPNLSHVDNHNTNDHHGTTHQQSFQQVNKDQSKNQSSQQQWNTQQQASQNWQASQQQQNYNSNGYGDNYNAGLSCWKCNADSFELCQSSGYVEKCHSNQQVCELEIRERMGYIYQIHMGCKSEDACMNNKRANFDQQNPHYTQCRPEKNMGYHHSVCRQCCNDNMCTKEPTWWYPTTREEWAYE